MGNAVKGLDELSRVLSKRHEYLTDIKATSGRKLIGYFADDVVIPEELIDAAGLMPTRLFGGAKSPGALVAQHLPHYMCAFARSSLELCLDGTLAYLDGIVMAHGCDTVAKVYDSWREHSALSFAYLLDMPRQRNELACSYFSAELRVFKATLEEYTGTPISDESLRLAIRKYNENRRLLRSCHEARSSGRSSLTGSDMLRIVMAGQIMPKEQHTRILNELLQAADAGSDRAGPEPARLLVSSVCMTDTHLLQLVEERGVHVVADDFCTGSRYYMTDVDEDRPPLEALARRYVERVPGPLVEPLEVRLENLTKLARRDHVDGVILYVMKHCDPLLLEVPSLADAVRDIGLPVLVLEGGDDGRAWQKTARSVEPFLEMIRGEA